MHHSGTIPGVGPADGGHTVYVDLDTMQIVETTPIIQCPMDEPPVETPTSEQPPAKDVSTPDAVHDTSSEKGV